MEFKHATDADAIEAIIGLTGIVRAGELVSRRNDAGLFGNAILSKVTVITLGDSPAFASSSPAEPLTDEEACALLEEIAVSLEPPAEGEPQKAIAIPPWLFDWVVALLKKLFGF
jgi:hypothetical protein